MPGELPRQSTRKPARKLEPGDVLADGLVVERVELSEGARSTSRLTAEERNRQGAAGGVARSGYAIEVDIVRVYVEGGDPRIPRRFWPRQKVEVRNG